MRIAQVAPLHLAVPPHNYGGTERCIFNIAEALIELGHEVTLFATADSYTRGRLVAMREKPIGFDPAMDATAIHLAMLKQVYERAAEFDVIHSHLDYLTLPFAQASTTPTVTTLHGRLDKPTEREMLLAFKNSNYVAISNSQRSQIPDLNWLSTIHHGVDLRRYPRYDSAGSYLAFVGRISPEKGPDRAIRIAKRMGIPLKIAAKVDPNDREYFEQVITPMLDDPLITYLGPVDERGKCDLMGRALALLLPISWPEPFGMVFIESLACGTPVLTCPHGSAPELLEDGVTGFMRETDDELVEAIDQVRHISRAGCREYVRRQFDIRDMALEYVNVYSMIQQQRRLFGSAAEISTGAPVGLLTGADQQLDQSSLIS